MRPVNRAAARREQRRSDPLIRRHRVQRPGKSFFMALELFLEDGEPVLRHLCLVGNQEGSILLMSETSSKCLSKE